MPAWMHARAEHILAKNPSMPKSEAFAIATQQSHALGKTPKSYGTSSGKHVAKEKYDTPGDDKRTANPGKLKSSVMLKIGQSLLPLAALGAGTGLATMGGIYASVGEKGRKRINSEIRDPRLYSNLRGITESAEDRVAAHKHLKRGKHTVLSAMHEGFTRGGKEKKAWEDKIHGGLSDKKTPEQFDSSSLREGEKVEKEHTSDKHLQTEIAMDHLTEDPEYYRKLKKMESDEKRATLLAFYDELQKIAEEKDALWGKATSSLPATSRTAPVVQPRVARQAGFTPAPVGYRGNVASPPTTVKPQPPRNAPLNPGGMM